ncbi:hypothetical protein J7384_18510 [Endozoicomonas sp. G2_1]|uniref:hypothetical protein n=1 Tax=Endozoicomonas sp. G2_1 TaxID=2821091 RepID=UPI001ADC1FF7|nr:hypothetical protein [Endozoicomonas sp. G2_1]MBO9492361.1 hypothetical protein [Endozoicomonas sp. G2_1]
MNASEFYQLSNDLGKKYIEPLGFKSNTKGDWYYVGEDYMLAFVLQNHNSSQHFDTKYITLIFNSYIKTKDIAPMKPMKHADGPMKINPLKLKGYIESNFDDKEWHYINDGKGFSNSHCPIYYGGVKKKAFTSIFSKAVPNRVTVQEFITNRGVEIVSEKEAYKQFEKCFKSVAVYGFKWAEHLTFDEILRQLQKYGENWFVVNEWIEAYETNNKYKI